MLDVVAASDLLAGDQTSFGFLKKTSYCRSFGQYLY